MFREGHDAVAATVVLVRPDGTDHTSVRMAAMEPGTDRYRAVAGRERGELLEVVRATDGSVDKLYFATYAVTRAPLAFADLQR